MIDAPDPRAARERIELELRDARELVALRAKDITLCLERGLAWNHPTVRTYKSRLIAAVADVQCLELLLTPPAPCHPDDEP